MPTGHPRPYRQDAINRVYNLLFCDDLDLFRTAEVTPQGSPLGVILASNPDRGAIEAIANDSQAESRARALAFNWLRRRSAAVPSKRLLGVIVEVPLQGGLDVLAVYADGRIRYINQTGKLVVFEESPPAISSKARELIAVSQPVVNQIGPWQDPRLPPPKKGNVRMTFLVSDGLYFGEGPFEDMQREAMAAPIIRRAGELLALIVGTVVR
jgi:hypothetical protein